MYKGVKSRVQICIDDRPYGLKLTNKMILYRYLFTRREKRTQISDTIGKMYRYESQLRMYGYVLRTVKRAVHKTTVLYQSINQSVNQSTNQTCILIQQIINSWLMH